MKRLLAAMSPLFFALLLGATARAQSDCTALNAASGEGKFTGQISTQPDGNSMQVTYGDQTVLVHYSNSVTVCQGGRPGSLNALTRGASVSVFGPLHRNGKNIEIDAARIFVAGPPQAARSNPPHTMQPGSSQTAAPNPPPTSQLSPGPLRSNTPPALPRLAPLHTVSTSVILGGATYAETMQRLHVVRKYELAALRTSPQVTVGQARLDFRPMLNNPRALFNVAQQLHQIPQHVQVMEESSDVSEVNEGLVIHHVLSYRILPGKCSDPEAKAQLARAGVGCFTRAPINERLAEFSKPGSPRYVRIPEKRQQAIATFQRNNAQVEADANKGIAQLRTALANPTQRASIVAQVGEAEAARMGSLSDDQLKEEVINSSVHRFEETMFVPKVESANYAHPQHPLMIAAGSAEMDAAQRLLRDGVPEHSGGVPGFPKLLKLVPARPLNPSTSPTGDRVAEAELGPYIFLAGFTISHDYEWSWGAWVTINWCLVGCSSTYGIGLDAGFNYAFGLRFPIHTQFKYHTVVHPNNSAEAELIATVYPIQGTAQDFLSSELSPEQLFNAQELVAQAGAHAGFNISLPGLNPSDDFKLNVDFTQQLPPPFQGGVFPPPAPGGHLDGQLLLDSIDLLGGLLNFGVAGGQLSPAVDISLHSNKLQFTVNDENLRRQTLITSNPQTVSLRVAPMPTGNETRFSVGNPVYNLGFTLTPGLNPNIWINIDVWSDQWNWPIWFPQLAITLPSNGIDFGCHAGTTCVVNFTELYNASTGQVRDVSREADAADRTLTYEKKCSGVGARNPGEPGKYLCPVKGGMYALCQTMLQNGAVASCGATVPDVVDQILSRGHCKGNNANYACPHDMMGLCNAYLKNQEILSCKQSN